MLENQVQVELLNTNGESEGFFYPKQWQSFADAADESWLSLPTSCCSWACFVCACRMVEWEKDIDIWLVSVPLVDIDEDQVLTCVWWIKDSIFSDWKFHKIVLQKLV